MTALAGILILTNVGGCGRSGPPEDHVPSLEPVRTVRIPTIIVLHDSIPASEQTGALGFTTGGEDELREGPSAFDVLPAEIFVVADPVRRRIVLFDSLGRYRSSVPTGFPASTMRRTGDHAIEVTNARTGDTLGYTIFDNSLVPTGTRQPNLDGQPSWRARKLSTHAGEAWYAGPPGSSPFDTLAIRIRPGAEQLLSLRVIPAQEEGAAYVALDLGQVKEVLDIRTVVRKYRPDGRVVCCCSAAAQEYDVVPEEPFKVLRGRIYQFIPNIQGTILRVWETNDYH